MLRNSITLFKKQFSVKILGHLLVVTIFILQVLMKNGGLISWNRGFDENNKLVWGAEKGGYVFMKVKQN